MAQKDRCSEKSARNSELASLNKVAGIPQARTRRALHILAVDPQRRQTLLAREGRNETLGTRGKSNLII